MKIKRFIIFFSLLFFTSGIVFLHFLGKIRERPQQMVSINEINQVVNEQWDVFLRKGNPDFSDLKESLDFSVLTISGSVLYKTNLQTADTIQDALSKNYMIVDVVYRNEIVGKILINTAVDDWLFQNQRMLFVFFVFFMLIEFISMIIFLLKIRRSIFVPFKKLDNFAVHVAGGNLDFPLEMDKSNVFGAFSESFDLMREELKQSREKERLVEKSKKELVAKLSHDINTPVASILAVSELMQISVESEKEREQLIIIHEKAKWIDTLISDLFQATLEELQNILVHPVEKDSQILIPLIAASDYLKRVDVDSVPACMLQVDEIRMQQIFDNIIGNAYKYADTNLKVSFSFESEFLLVKIKDFGKGVPSSELPFLFEKYYRGQNAKEKDGAGLGLHISRYLIQQMGGDISCNNEQDGFCMIIYLRLTTPS